MRSRSWRWRAWSNRAWTSTPCPRPRQRRNRCEQRQPAEQRARPEPARRVGEADVALASRNEDADERSVDGDQTELLTIAEGGVPAGVDRDGHAQQVGPR